MNKFQPDTKTKFTLDSGVTSQIFAESISQAGGVIVITAHARNDKSLGDGYGLTHRLTGCTLTGARLTSDIPLLKTKARRFWRALSTKQKKVWQTQTNHTILGANTPSNAKRELC